MGIRLKDLSKLGYTDNVARSLAVTVVSKYCKHESKEEILAQLADVLDNPENHKNSDVWGKLAERLSPTITERNFQVYELKELPLGYKIYGNKFIETTAKQQMELAMRLPVTLTGALMPDAHAGYGLPIGGVLAVDNAVIPYAVGMDIGCRMSLTVFDAKPDFLRRYAHQAKIALKEYTHFGMDGGLEFIQEHEVLDREEFRLTPLLQKLHGKAVRQLGTSGQGNHFVNFGELELQEKNALQLNLHVIINVRQLPIKMFTDWIWRQEKSVIFLLKKMLLLSDLAVLKVNGFRFQTMALITKLVIIP